jgi:hypothetical protein
LLKGHLLEKGDRDDLVPTVLQNTLWEGRIGVAANVLTPGRHRLVVAEYEEYLTDTPASPQDPLVAYEQHRSKGRRLVFVDHVPVDL